MKNKKSHKTMSLIIIGLMFCALLFNEGSSISSNSMKTLQYEANFFTIFDTENYYGNEDGTLFVIIQFSDAKNDYTFTFTPNEDPNNPIVISRFINTGDENWIHPFTIELEEPINHFILSKSPEENITGHISETDRFLQMGVNKKVECNLIETEETLPNNVSNYFYFSKRENVCVFGAILGNDSFLCSLFDFSYINIRFKLIDSDPQLETQFHFSVGIEISICVGVVFTFIALFFFVRHRRKIVIQEQSKKKHRSKNTNRK